MNDNYTYFQATNNAFWRWEDGGDVIALTNGTTIAYKGFIVEVIKSLENQGIPSFGVLLLAIIATNDYTWEQFVRDYWNDDEGSSFYGLMKDEDVLCFQETLAALPNKYKKGEKRFLVFRAIFENGHNLKSPKKTRRILKLLERDLFDREDFIMDDATDKRRLNGYRTLGLLNRRFPDVGTILRAIAGLPEIPETTLEIVEMPQGESEPKDFVQELVENFKTFQLGALIKRIWSGMNIPMHAILPNEQKLGGVADLTNKGTFDKLLISEFAYDDLTFMSRLANQEALYLNRERPPNAESQERVILIDTSIKTWGTPRTIAYAIMIAIAKHPKSKLNCRAFVLGRECLEIAFDNIDDVIDALTHLDTALNPTDGLTVFFKDFKSTAYNEVVLITIAELLNDVTVQKALFDYHNQINYIVTTDHLGEIDFYKNQQRSRKHIQHLALPLVELWDKKQRPKQKQKGKNNLDGFGNIKSIILFPPQKCQTFLVDNHSSVFAVTADRRIYQLPDQAKIRQDRRGWTLICEGISPKAFILCMGRLENGSLYVLYSYPKEKVVVVLNLENNKERRITLDDWDGKINNAKIYFKEDKFVLQTHNKAWVLYPNIMKFVEKGEPDELASQYIEALNRKIIEPKRNIPKFSVIRNLSSVRINIENKLVINNHALGLNSQEKIKWKRNNAFDFSQEANTSKDDLKIFTFLDGSIIKIVYGGILMLNSSNENIPIIYIPTTLDQPLGMATEHHFCGNTYYLNPHEKASAQHSILTTVFYDEYVNKFIEHILNNV